MDRLNIAATGYRGTNQSWRFLQECFRNPLFAIGWLAGDRTILHGVNVGQSGTTVTAGFIAVQGEIIPFEAGPFANTVTIIETVENSTYNTDVNNDQQLDSLPTYIKRVAKCGTGGEETFNFSDLVRLDTIKSLSQFTLPANLVQDPNYVHTDNNLTTQMISTWNALISNVRADWNVSNPQSQAYILNKPTNLLTVLKKGDKYFGDIYVGNSVFNCTFPDIGTSSYQVHGTFEIVGGGEINVFWATGAKTSTYFTIHTGESYGTGQLLRFRYFLTPIYSN